MSTKQKPFEVMPVEVYVGGAGHIVLCQEWPDLQEGESYLRVMLNPADAEAICEKIMAMARRVRP